MIGSEIGSPAVLPRQGQAAMGWWAVLKRAYVALALAFLLASSLSWAEAQESGASELLLAPIPLEAWREPPREVRPVARWWWPGGSVEEPTLRRQLLEIRRAGFGGVELQPLLLGMGEEDLAADPRIRSVGQPLFFDRVGQAAAIAAEIGLDFDLTLGSGWPGGLPISTENAERQLLMATMDVQGPKAFDGPLPPPPGASYRGAVEWVLDVLGPPDAAVELGAVVAARLGPEREGATRLAEIRVITDHAKNGSLAWGVPPGEWRIFAFYTNATSHFVMGGAYPGDESAALVIDHLSRRGADALLEGYGAPALQAAGGQPIRGVFVDSFELMGELPFTADFSDAFQRHTGYDVTPYLPTLFRRGGESKYAEMVDVFGRMGGPLYGLPEAGQAERIREDYEEVRQLLFEQKFVARFAEWAAARNLEFRLQAHGGFGDYLDTYALADVPESEGLFAGGSFDFLKLAASAAHVAGRRWASSEAFITMGPFGTRLDRDEMHLLAGRAYSAGINRLVFHGVPYPYQRVDGENWYPFPGGFGRILAGPFAMTSEIGAEFLAELPGFNLFLARVSLAMSHGEPSAEVAWLRADPAYPDAPSIEWGRVDPKTGESPTTRALRARGLVHDRISRRMLAGAQAGEGEFSVGARSYRALILDPLEVAEPALVHRIGELAASGVPVFALGQLPERAPGWRDAEARDLAVRRGVGKLAPRVIDASPGPGLEEQLAQNVRGEILEPLPGESLKVSIARRETPEGAIVLIFNESWSDEKARFRFTRKGHSLMSWDPSTGTRTVLQARVEPGDEVAVELKPAELRILTLAESP